MRFSDVTDDLLACYRGSRVRDKPRAGRIACVLGWLVMAVQAGAFAQPLPEVEVDVISSRVYTSAVDAYADGRRHEGLARLARVVPSAVFETARSTLPTWAAPARITTSGDDMDGQARSTATRRWRAAAVLHLDTAWRLVQRYRADAVDPHLRAADLALDRLRSLDPSPETDLFRARCAIARLHHLTVAGRHEELDRSVAAMRVPAALQGEVLFVRALSHETRARATPPRLERRPTRATAPLQSATMAGARRVWLDNHLRYAAGLYRQVLALEAGAREARLRLARVQLEGGASDVALDTLAPLTTTGCADAVCAMAWLARGEALEARGDVDAAREAYEQTLASPPVRDAAIVALLTLDAGRPLNAGAAAAGADVPSDAQGYAPPAWRAYLLGISHRHATLMTTLQEAVR